VSVTLPHTDTAWQHLRHLKAFPAATWTLSPKCCSHCRGSAAGSPKCPLHCVHCSAALALGCRGATRTGSWSVRPVAQLLTLLHTHNGLYGITLSPVLSTSLAQLPLKPTLLSTQCSCRLGSKPTMRCSPSSASVFTSTICPPLVVLPTNNAQPKLCIPGLLLWPAT